MIKLLAFTAPLFFIRIAESSLYLYDMLLLVSFLIGIRKLRFEFRLYLPALFYIIFCIISIFYGVIVHDFDIEQSLQSLVRYSFMLLVIPLVSGVFFSNESQLDEYFKYLAFGLAASVIINFVGVYLAWMPFWGTGRAHGFYGNANWFGYMMVFSMYSFYYLSAKNSKYLVICLPLFVLSMYNLILSGSNSSLIALVILVIWIFFSDINFTKIIVFSLLIVIFPMFILILSNFEYFSDFRGATRFLNFFTVLFGNDSDGVSSLGSITERLELIDASITAYIDYSGFFIGYGLSQTPNLFNSLGFHEASVHVNLISILIEVGFLGLLMYAAWLIFGYLNFLRGGLSDFNNNYIKGNVILFVFVGMFTPHVYLGFFFAFIVPMWGRYKNRMGL